MSLLAVALGLFAPLNLPVLEVPSGQSITLHEVLIDEVGTETWLRFRFLAPQIARETGTITFTQVEPDFEHLCTHVALPYIVEYELNPQMVAVSLLDQPVEFGMSDPNVTQFVDMFRVTSGACVWEGL